MLMTGFPLTGALGLMMPYVPVPVMEALAFALLVSSRHVDSGIAENFSFVQRYGSMQDGSMSSSR
jgi:hypothetical protein